ncbi:MAG: sigma-54-dependent transcriptional regulator [Gammaproteobacteria bacterium]|jgi:two-component system nitrogen regulation response regulator NtrX|tara:strand:+ start:6089 stop:7459 length:1371 start_codon:yes stop_codon:yes gene_type:complete
MKKSHILIIDDEPDIRSLLKDILEDEGYEISVAENATDARKLRRQRRPDLILLDIWMPDTDGISLLKEWSSDQGVLPPVVMMSGHGTIDTAIEATRLGAYDFVEKPLSIAKIILTVENALEADRLKSENLSFEKKSGKVAAPVGSSETMSLLLKAALKIADHKTSIFISGASGTGKETLARFIHHNSPRSQGRFVEVNVSAMTRDNPEEELFGFEKGEKLRFGALELANGGTLFLKEIADMDLGTQARLLKALENQEFIRSGGQKNVRIDVRLMSSSRHDLKPLIEEGRFREDLFYHLNVLPLKVPSLKERSEDIEELLDYFLKQFASSENLPLREFSSEIRQKFKLYSWPGNIRELRNFIQRILILGSHNHVELKEITPIIKHQADSRTNQLEMGFNLPLREAREQFEKAYIEYQMQIFNGSVSRVSTQIGIERTHLYRKLRSLGIDPKQLKDNY